MHTLIKSPTIINAVGEPPKAIEEFIGPVNSGTEAVSISRMKSPAGWAEVGQRPEFTEFSVVLAGELHCDSEDGGTTIVRAGQAVMIKSGDWVRYHTPGAKGADYISVCLPAFSPETVHRDPE
jgi:mannose-6-phosphate isomerase-like protein (cupin superfamily)